MRCRYRLSSVGARRYPAPAANLARALGSPLPLAFARLPRLIRAAFAAPDAVRNGLRVGHVVVPVLCDGGAPATAARGVAPLGRDGLPGPPRSLEQCEALKEQSLFMLEAGLQARGRAGADRRRPRASPKCVAGTFRKASRGVAATPRPRRG